MSLLKNKIHYDPTASITKLPKLDPHGNHKLTKHEAEEIEELAEKYPDLLSFMKHLNRGSCDLVDAINKAMYLRSFKRLNELEQLYESQKSFIFNCHYPHFYYDYLDKVYEEHKNNVLKANI